MIFSEKIKKASEENTSSEAEKYMQRAIDLAKTAVGYTSPNPLVGCVVVKDGRIISEACHERYGEFHAERNALMRCKEDAKGADLYVTLEPCCHFGKTPPCTDIIIEKGIKRVYVGSLDSNPLVAGKGVEILKEHGIEVFTGILEAECIKMNEIFFHYITHKTPFVALKYAMTLDGRIAAYTGDSKWVTNENSRRHVQYLRKKYAAIMVGINTVISDNPMLNCRIAEAANPVRVILDSNLRIPLEDNNIAATAKDIRTIVAYSANNENDTLLEKKRQLIEKGMEVVKVPDIQGAENYKVNIKNLMKLLGEMKIDSVLIEGGAEINAAAIEAGVVNKVYAYIAPKLIMGKNAKGPVGGSGIPLMSDAIKLKNSSVRIMNETDRTGTDTEDFSDVDILVEGYVM